MIPGRKKENRNDICLLLTSVNLARRAYKCFETTLKLDPVHVAALCNFGALLHHSQRFQESEAMYVKALNLDAKCNQAWCNLGALQTLRRDFAGAERSYSNAMALDPHHETTLYNYGILKGEQGQSEVAHELLNR